MSDCLKMCYTFLYHGDWCFHIVQAEGMVLSVRICTSAQPATNLGIRASIILSFTLIYIIHRTILHVITHCMYSIFHSGTLYLTLENRASNMHWHIRLNLPLSHALCGEALSCSITLEPEFSLLVKYSACRQQWLGIIFPYCSSEICALSDL